MGRSKDNELTGNQRTVIRALIAGRTKRQAAKIAKVSPQTVSNWMGSPPFRTALRAAQDAALAGTVRLLIAGAHNMLGVLEDIAIDEDIAPGTRVQAARTWLSNVFRGIEIQELAERVAQLEDLARGDEL